MYQFPVEVAPLLIYVITQGVKSVFGGISGKASMVVAAFVGGLLIFGTDVINGFGPEVATIVGPIVNLLLLVLGGYGTHAALKYHIGGASKPPQ